MGVVGDTRMFADEWKAFTLSLPYYWRLEKRQRGAHWLVPIVKNIEDENGSNSHTNETGGDNEH